MSSSDCNRICYVGTCVYVEGGSGHCEYTPLICDDGDPCTDDACNGGVCQFVQRVCNVDNLFCTADFCDSLGTCREGLVSPCTPPTPKCDENLQIPNTGRCVECLDDTDCADNPARHRCDTDPGVCVQCFDDLQCDDNIACTSETCHNGICNVGNDICPGQDGQFCNGVEWCDGVVGAGTCQPGDPPCTGTLGCNETTNTCIYCQTDEECLDAYACTTHTCDLSGGDGVCVVTTDDSLCDNGVFCDGAETCDDQLGCVNGPDPCLAPTPLCFENPPRCGDCISDADCEDNVGCTADSCVNNLCQNTDTCDDLDSCNGTESCNMATGVCDTANDALQCSPPLLWCYQSQCVRCVASLGEECYPDGDPCTEDICLPDNTCIFDPDSDNDGVPNCCDNCPNTIGTADIQCNGTWLNPGDPGCVCDNPYPPACAGDPPVEGCSCYQLDSDGDGLNDCGEGGDACPCVAGCPAKKGCVCYPGETCCSTDPLSLCYCAP